MPALTAVRQEYQLFPRRRRVCRGWVNTKSHSCLLAGTTFFFEIRTLWTDST